MENHIMGKVVEGLHIGKKIGFPTVNIEAKNTKDIEFGIYICEVKIDGEIYKGVMHYGTKSIGTDNPSKVFCEAHIFDFDKDVYNRNIEIKLLKKIREVRKFSSEAELKKQIAKDIKITNKYFNAE